MVPPVPMTSSSGWACTGMRVSRWAGGDVSVMRQILACRPCGPGRPRRAARARRRHGRRRVVRARLHVTGTLPPRQRSRSQPRRQAVASRVAAARRLRSAPTRDGVVLGHLAGYCSTASPTTRAGRGRYWRPEPAVTAVPPSTATRCQLHRLSAAALALAVTLVAAPARRADAAAPTPVRAAEPPTPEPTAPIDGAASRRPDRRQPSAAPSEAPTAEPGRRGPRGPGLGHRGAHRRRDRRAVHDRRLRRPARSSWSRWPSGAPTAAPSRAGSRRPLRSSTRTPSRTSS